MRTIQKKKRKKKTNMQFKVILSEPRQKDSGFKQRPRGTSLDLVNG